MYLENAHVRKLLVYVGKYSVQAFSYQVKELCLVYLFNKKDTHTT